MDIKSPYAQLAPYYDALFFALGKDYKLESQKVTELLAEHKKSGGNQLLDLGCGTGEHIKYLKSEYEIIGIDASHEMLESARKKNPEVPFFQMDMLNFQIDQMFDAVICLFSAIGYLVTKENLEKTVGNVSRHLKIGGVFIVEPWYSPEEIEKYRDLVEFGEKQGITACRMRETEVVGNIAKSKGHILVSQGGHVKHQISHHVFGLFTRNDFAEAFEKNDLKICSSKYDLSGRGLYIGVKAA